MEGNQFNEIVKKLSDVDAFSVLHHSSVHNVPMPSVEILEQLLNNIQKVLFPGFFGYSEINASNRNYFIGANVDKVLRALTEQIKRGLCFDCTDVKRLCSDCEIRAKTAAEKFVARLSELKSMLSKDVIAAYKGDPAAKSYGETIFCYPSILTVTYHRIAHELIKLDVPLIPRIIAELAHSRTGIDIHPGATIGEYFFIDHGTGVVIGETAIIGNNVRIYQGVTLGAKSFPLDENGKPIKGIPRHPIVEDDVTIYASATILGRITIGKGSTIGGNIWVTKDVKPDSRVLQSTN